MIGFLVVAVFSAMNLLRGISIVLSQLPNGAQPERRSRRELDANRTDTRVWSRGLGQHSISNSVNIMTPSSLLRECQCVTSISADNWLLVKSSCQS
jgi:hypothetical protein